MIILLFRFLGDKRIEIIDFLNEVSEKIAESRQNIRLRNKIYDEDLYDNWFEKLIKFRKLLYGPLIPDIIKLHNKQKREHNKQKRNMLIAIGVGVAGLIIGIIGVII